MNPTHDPALRSWVESANHGETDFPIQNLPHGVFRRRGSTEPWRGGVAIGACILDVRAAAAQGVFAAAVAEAVRAAGADALNGLMALGPHDWSALRAELSRVLRHGAPEATLLRESLVAQADAEFTLPARIGDYTDCFTSWHHMVNAGRVFRPDAPPLPNFRWMPIAYHGRASSIEVSGAPVFRPGGQMVAAGEDRPHFGPSQRLDYELELAFWVGPGNPRGRPVPIGEAAGHVFGLSLLNDWSARDIQAWEGVPLGPFLAKNFISTVSPWVITLEALEPFRCPLPRSADDPPALPHLQDPDPQPGYDLRIEAWLQTRRSGPRAMRLSRSSFRHCYWSIAQMLAHHTTGGCNLRPGDLIGTGTQSGPEPGEQGCLLELTKGGAAPVALEDGEVRRWLEDGDTVTLKAWAERPGAARIGFGECSGTVFAV